SSSCGPVALSPASEPSKNTSGSDVNRSNTLSRSRVATALLNASRIAITAASVCASAFIDYAESVVFQDLGEPLERHLKTLVGSATVVAWIFCVPVRDTG